MPTERVTTSKESCEHAVAKVAGTDLCLRCFYVDRTTPKTVKRAPGRAPVQANRVLAVAPPPSDAPWTLEVLGAPAISFAVAGEPSPEGSFDPFINPATGKAMLRPQQAESLDAWRDAVQDAAKEACGGGWVPLDGPLVMDLVVTLARGSRPRWVEFSSTPPDLDKLARATNDAMSPVKPPRVKKGKVSRPRHPRPVWQGLWVDDARVAAYRRLDARYVGSLDPDTLGHPGAVIRVWQIPARLVDQRKG